jgi:hypothetical protein
MIVRLALDLDMADRLLYQMVNFYRAFPIVQAPAQLTWTHHQK